MPQMTRLLEGKIALVTSAGSDIGRASAMVMAREGATVVVSDVTADAGESTLDAVKGVGGVGMFVRCDIADADQGRNLIARTVDCYGRLDCACNHAESRICAARTLHDTPEDTWDRLIDVELKSIWVGLKIELAQMLRQGGGAIVNVASVAGFVGSPPQSAYAASRHAVVGLTKTAALEYAREGIRVNAACFAGVNLPTATPPDERSSDARTHAATRQLAEAIAWLCSDAASLTTGVAMTVDYGRYRRDV